MQKQYFHIGVHTTHNNPQRHTHKTQKLLANYMHTHNQLHTSKQAKKTDQQGDKFLLLNMSTTD